MKMPGEWPVLGLSLLTVLMTTAVQSHNVALDLYRPLYEAQRGPAVRLKDLNQSSNSSPSNCSLLFADLLFNRDTAAEAVAALDATGKPGSGLLAGNWAWLGHFSECSNLQDFKYCLLNLDVDAVKLHVNELFKVKDIPIQWGVCPPRQCSSAEVVEEIQQLLDWLDLSYSGLNLVNISATAHCVEKPVVPYGAGFIITMVVCGIIGLLMTAGTVIDIIETKLKEGTEGGLSVQSGDITPLLAGQPNGVAEGAANGQINGGPDTYQQLSQVRTGWRRVAHKLLAGVRAVCLDFAFNRNLAKLIQIGEGNRRSIDCLHGIRVLSMFWVILGHVYFFPFVYQGIFNVGDALGWMKNVMFQTVINAYFSVDTFFFLSGLLVCYLTLLRLQQRNGKLPWLWIYIHRYIRLTPVLIAAMMVWMYITPYTLWGPKAGLMAMRPYCPNYWWANLLYIQNFYPAEFGKACIGWTWYLANDMQFFVISPLIIYALYRIPAIGFGLICALLSVSFAVTGALTAHYNFSAAQTSVILTGGNTTADYGNIIYQKPYVRIPPYLVGMILGYVLYRLRDRQPTLSRVQLAVGWFIATGVALSSLYGLYGNYNGHPMKMPGNVIYEMLSRFAWAVFLSWVVVACKYGTPGWVNTVLCWKFWIPLSRLTYTAYMLHPMVITTFLGNFGTPYYVSQVLQVFFFFGVIVMSYLWALVLSLAVEFPLANMEKHFMPKM